jgi:bifunctional N-acetylglucosamine-1-phosphate-uridyltransferase/glucosamine-1-phosphate-acetyltransferase GlmU-like protein
MTIKLRDFLSSIERSPFASSADDAPWTVTAGLAGLLENLMRQLGSDYVVADGIGVHRLATIEPGAIVKPPAILSAGSFVAASAYLRGGVFLGEACTIGPGVEFKTSILLSGSKIAHLSFVGDSIVGQDVNCEAGCVLANYRNENEDKRIRIRWGDSTIDTGVEKFGALVGDGARIGANAVIAPGSLIRPRSLIPRLSLLDQEPS